MAASDPGSLGIERLERIRANDSGGFNDHEAQNDEASNACFGQRHARNSGKDLRQQERADYDGGF